MTLLSSCDVIKESSAAISIHPTTDVFRDFSAAIFDLAIYVPSLPMSLEVKLSDTKNLNSDQPRNT